MPSVQDQKRKAAVEARGREAHFRFDCLQGSLQVPHKGVIPLTFKGRLGKDAILYGYDGPCRLGHQHSRTFVMQNEYIAYCTACNNTTRPVEGSLCGVCGNPVEARKLWIYHTMEEGMREHARPIGGKKRKQKREEQAT